MTNPSKMFLKLKSDSNNFRRKEIFNEVIITPEMATDLLTLNTKNRNIRTKRVLKLAEAIKEGKWMCNGDTIRISKNSVLMDGQHRLLACVSAGKMIKSIIVTGLEEEAFATIDTGASRSSGDTMSFLGCKNAATLSGLIKWMYSYEISKDFHKSRRTYMDNQDLKAYWDLLDTKEKERIENAASRASGYHKKFNSLSQSQAAFFYYLFNSIDAFKAEEFFYLLTTGDGIGSKNKPSIWLLREKLVKFSDDKYNQTDLTMRNALIIKAWNVYIKGADLKQLKWDDREPFPKVDKK